MKQRPFALALLIAGLSLSFLMGTGTAIAEETTAYPLSELQVQKQQIASLHLPQQAQQWKDSDSPISAEGQATWKEGDSLGRLLQVLGIQTLNFPQFSNGSYTFNSLTEADRPAIEALLALPVKSHPLFDVGMTAFPLYRGADECLLRSPRVLFSLRSPDSDPDLVQIAYEEGYDGTLARNLMATLDQAGNLCWGREENFRAVGDSPVFEQASPILNHWQIEGLGQWIADWKSQHEGS